MNRKKYLNKMVEDKVPSLFTPKDMYVMSTTQSGHSNLYYQLSQTDRRKLTYNNMHLALGIEYTEKNSIPIMKPYNGTLEYEFRRFSERSKCIGKGQALMVFEDDYKYKHLLWDRLEQTTATLTKFDCLFTPDFSLYVDAPLHLNRDRIYKSRFVGAYWQKCGFNVIATASWAGANLYGVRQIEELLLPTTIIIYGKEIEIPGIYVPVMFIEDHITKYFRNENNRK